MLQQKFKKITPKEQLNHPHAFIRKEMCVVSKIMGHNILTSKFIEFDVPTRNVERIVKDVLVFFPDINLDHLVSPSRKRKYVIPRHMCFYFLYKYGHKLTLREIGEYFGGRDHSSVHSGIEAVIEDFESDKRYLKFFTQIENHVVKNQ